MRQLEQRRESILKTIEGQGKLTQELSDKIIAAETLSTLEDLYLPVQTKTSHQSYSCPRKRLGVISSIDISSANKRIIPRGFTVCE